MFGHPLLVLETKMTDWQKSTRADYEQKGFAARSGYGRSPAFLIVDFINGFTDPKTPLGGDFAWEINATRQLLEAFRRCGLSLYNSRPSHSNNLGGGGVFAKRVLSLSMVQKCSPRVDLDQR